MSAWLQEHVRARLDSDPAWRHLMVCQLGSNDVIAETGQVFLSDAAVPGEGEHKILEFIRKQRQDPLYNAKMARHRATAAVHHMAQRHVIYGCDADLILLGLATHERSVTILRDRPRKRSCDGVAADPAHCGREVCGLCNGKGHTTLTCNGKAAPAPLQVLMEHCCAALNTGRCRRCALCRSSWTC